MAAQNPPSFMQNVATETAAQARNLITALVSSQGIIAPGDMAVSQHLTGNMSVDVAGGAAFINGTSATLQGTYHVYSDSTVTNLAISTADPTNPRIDTVVASVQDAFYSGSNNQWLYQVVTGTPTSGATLVNLSGKGAVPANSIVLAYVLVPATATSIVTADLLDARPKAYLLGNPGLYKAQMHLQTSSATLTNNSAYVAVPYDTIDQDPLSMCTTGAAAHFTVPVAGWWAIIGAWTSALPAASLVVSTCYAKNSTANPITATRQQNQLWQNAAQTVIGSITTIEKLAAGDTVSIGAFQNGGSTLTFSGGASGAYASIHLLSV